MIARKWILCIAVLAFAGCTPDRLAVSGKLLSQDGGTIGTFEITDLQTEVNASGAVKAVLNMSAVDKDGRAMPMKNWRCAEQIGDQLITLGDGVQNKAEDAVEITVPLLNERGEAQNIGMQCSAWWDGFPNWMGEKSFLFSSVEAGMVTLTLAVQGQGVIHPAQGPHRYMPGMSVLLEAQPYVGWEFSGWQGNNVADAASASTRVVIGNKNETVTAVFVPKDWGTRAALYLQRNGSGLIADFDFGNRLLSQTWGLPQEAGIANISGFGLKTLPTDLSTSYVEMYQVNGEGEGEGEDWYPLDLLNPVLTDVQFVGTGFDESGADAVFDFHQPFWLAGPGITLRNLEAANGLYLPLPDQVDVYEDGKQVLPDINNGYYLIGVGGFRIADQTQGPLNVGVGWHVTMFVSAEGGQPPLSYQWCKNGTMPENYITGSTNSTLDFPSVVKEDSGEYVCSVSDSSGQKVLVEFATKEGRSP